MTRIPPARGLVALAVALLLSLPTQGGQSAAPTGVLGRWAGSAKLTNEWGASPCDYTGGESPPAVTLDVESKGDNVEVTATIDLPGTPGAPCPPVHKRYTIDAARVTESTLGFRDPAGHEWNLALRADRLQGLLNWKTGPDEILAEGFTGPSGERPLIRLSGEVSLARLSGGEPAAPSATAATTEAEAGAPGAGTPPKGSADKGKAEKGGGKGLGLLPSILAANVVGLAAFYGIKKATDDSGQNTGNATCSPRDCVFAGPADPCECNIPNITSGGSCGNVPGGTPFGGSCKLPNRPCQAGLSCNNGICDDKFGRCPF
jgi:hypothetical protein